MPDVTRRPVQAELLALLARASAGDDLAYERIRAGWHEPLVGLVRRLTGWNEAAAREVTELIWKNQRTLITRADTRGGYGLAPIPPANRPRMFHTYVLMDCTDWGRVLARHAEIDPAAVADLTAVEQMVEPAASPPEVMQRLHACETLLGLICHPRTGYPHQQLAFLYAKYLFARGPGEGQGDALRTDLECGEQSLSGLVDRLHTEVSWLWEHRRTDPARTSDRVRKSFSRRLGLTVGEMFAENNDTQGARRFAHLLDRRVGETRLCDYYPSFEGERAEDRRRLVQNLIADWCRKVGVRLRDQLGCRASL